MTHETSVLTSNVDGLELKVDKFRPAGEAVGAVLIAHGLAEHGARYARFAEFLNKAGYAVYTHDHRGHGGSLFGEGRLGDAGEAGWNGLVADLVQHAEQVSSHHQDVPFILFGHSMGSFAAQAFLLDHSGAIDGCVLSGSTDVSVVAELVAASDEPPSLKAYNAPFEPARTDFDWLSRDEAEVDAYVADPLCGFDAPPEFMASMMGAAGPLGDPAKVGGIRSDLPLLVMAGDADPLNGELALLHSLVDRYQKAGLTNVATRYYAGGRHEMLNETNRDEVMADVLAWMKGVQKTRA